MPTFRAVIERTVVSREVVEVNAANLRAAAVKLDQYTVDRTQRRGIAVTRTHDDDDQSTEDDRVIELRERA